jgi:ribosome-associated protein
LCRQRWPRSSPPKASTPRQRARLVRDAHEDDRLSSTVQLAHRIAAIAAEKLAADIVLLDMRGVVTYTDHFVIASGRTPRQTQSIAEEIQQKLKRDRVLPRRVEGFRQGDWILLDFLDVVVHVFTPEARAYYRLEALWGEVPSESYAAG